MLGRNSFTQEKIASGERTMARQLAAFDRLASAVRNTGDAEAEAALEALEPVLFDSLALALDRFYVHRVRAVSGKDGNPLNELELVTDSLMTNDGVFEGNKVIKHSQQASVLGLAPGDPITLSRDDFERLSTAFFAELEARFG